MGNKQGHELSPEEKQKLKQEKEREKKLVREEKERKKREKKEEKKRKKDKKRGKNDKGPDGLDEEDGESIGGSSAWSEKSQGSAPGSWYHSASEPSSKRSSIYLPASAGPGYYQHDCWYSGYEDSGSEKSKPPSRAPSVKSVSSNLRASSLERYPLGVPKGEPIEPMHKAGSLDLTSVVAASFLQDREKLVAEAEVAATIASRYDETIRTSRDHLERTSVERASFLEKASLAERASLSERTSQADKVSLDSSVYQSAEEGSLRGAKRKVSLEDKESIKSSVYYSADEGRDSKRQTVDYASDRASLSGSIYYSADEGGSIAGSVYYSATSGSEVEDHGDDNELLGKERPSVPGKPEAVDREGGILNKLAYIKVENDALLLRWDPPDTDGGSPITGYIMERCEGDSEMWVRVNLVPIKDTEYPVANLVGGREYRFRVFAENAVGFSDPSTPSEMVSISTDQEATEPHFLRELRDVVAVAGQRVEFSVDIIGTPPPDVTWYKDGFEVYDTQRFQFLADGDRYMLILREARLADEGDIRVRATNRVGVASSQAALAVQAPPQITLPPQYEQGLIFDTDELIRLRVPYTGRPQPTASWTHNGKLIEADERHTMDVSEKYATLKIAGANRMDKGMYALKLTNPQGEASASFFVTVTDRPDPPSVPVITDVTGTSVTLRWDPPADDGGCRISNYTLEYFRVGWDVWLKAASSRITWTQLSDLIVGSEYRFRVKAENAYGVSEPGPESEQILIEDTKSPTGYENVDVRDARLGQTHTGWGDHHDMGGVVDFSGNESGVVIETVSLKYQQEQYEEELRLRNYNIYERENASILAGGFEGYAYEYGSAVQEGVQEPAAWLGVISPVYTTIHDLPPDEGDSHYYPSNETVATTLPSSPPHQFMSPYSPMNEWGGSFEEPSEDEDSSSEDTVTANNMQQGMSAHEGRELTLSPIGAQWMANGRMAIANQFRVICGGLASMNHLGNINDGKRETTYVEDSPKREDSIVNEHIASISAEDIDQIDNQDNSQENGDLPANQLQTSDHQKFYQPANQKGSQKDVPANHCSMYRIEELEASPPHLEYNLSDESDLSAIQNSFKSLSDTASASQEFDVLCKQEDTKKSRILQQQDLLSFSWSSSSSSQQHDTLNDASVWTLDSERQSKSVRPKEKLGKQASESRGDKKREGSVPSSKTIKKSKRHTFDYCDDTTMNDESNYDTCSSWEPKINQVITSRIDLLENLVYRCLENEDVTMNDLGLTDDEGSGPASPLAPLSRASSCGRVDVRKGELRDLINDLGELVSGMNERSRTMSAENVAKFFEKTACVVGEPGSPGPLLPGEKEIVEEIIKSNRSSRTHSIDERTFDELDISSEESFVNLMQPFDQVCIQSSILERISHLDELMARCLEHEDITLNTLGSPPCSPNPAVLPDPDEERLDTSKLALTGLIGNLGSLIKGLGQKFNAHSS